MTGKFRKFDGFMTVFKRHKNHSVLFINNCILIRYKPPPPLSNNISNNKNVIVKI